MQRYDRRLAATCCLALALALSGAACSDDSGTHPNDAGPADQTVTPDQPQPGPLTVTVLKIDDLADPETKLPAVGATVSAELPDGTVQEKTADAAGKVVFEAVAWAQGTASVTAYLPDYALDSQVGVTAATSSVELFVAKTTVPTRVRISGTAQNKATDFERLLVTSTVNGSTLSETKTDQYSLEVPSGQAFSLYALQFKISTPANPRDTEYTHQGWTKVDHTGATAAATVDLDLAQTLTPVSFTGTLVPPTDPKSVLQMGSMADIQVTTLESGTRLYAGLLTKSTFATDRFTYSGEYVDVPGAHMLTVYALNVGGGQTSWILVDGAPKDKATIEGFVEIPKVTQPTKLGLIHGPVLWTSDDTEAKAQLTLVRDDVPVWRVRAPAGTRALNIPPLPSTVDAASVLGTEPLQAILGQVREHDLKLMLITRGANTKPFELAVRAKVTGAFGLYDQSPIVGADVCLVDKDPTAYCTKTSSKGQFELDDVPVVEDQLISVETTDTKWLLSLGRFQESLAYGYELRTLAEIKAEQEGLGFPEKAGTGVVSVSLGTETSSLEGATITLNAADVDGPVYCDRASGCDKALTQTTSGATRFYNVPPGTYDLSIKTPTPMTCSPRHAWGKGDGNRFKVKVQAGWGTTIAVICR